MLVIHNKKKYDKTMEEINSMQKKKAKKIKEEIDYKIQLIESSDTINDFCTVSSRSGHYTHKLKVKGDITWATPIDHKNRMIFDYYADEIKAIILEYYYDYHKNSSGYKKC